MINQDASQTTKKNENTYEKHKTCKISSHEYLSNKKSNRFDSPFFTNYIRIIIQLLHILSLPSLFNVASGLRINEDDITNHGRSNLKTQNDGLTDSLNNQHHWNGYLGNSSSEFGLGFYPERIDDLNIGDETRIYVNVSGGWGVSEVGERDEGGDSHNKNQLHGAAILTVKSHDESIARVLSVITPSINDTIYTVVIKGVFIGRTLLEFTYQLENDTQATKVDDINLLNHPATRYHDEGILRKSTVHYIQPVEDPVQLAGGGQPGDALVYLLNVAVIREEGWVDQVFIASVSLVVLITNMGMGCKIDLDVVYEVLKRPIAPLIGFTCQFVIMPLVAYSLVILFDIRGGQALGFFATGCSPGGGASNMYTYILGGDVSLSVTMTLVSTTASFAMIPLWLYTLGTHFIDDKTNISIPFHNILVSLAGIIIPVGIGILIQRKKPAWAKSLRKCLKPLFIFLIIFLFTFGMWVNSYLFGLFTINMVLASSLLPYAGFLLSGGAALVCRQPVYRVITIIIETGIQNTGIPILLMKFSLPQPEADMSVIAPVMIAFCTPFPLWIAIAVRELHKKCCIVSDDQVDHDEIPEGKEVDENTCSFDKVFNDSEDDGNLSPLTSDVTDLGSDATFETARDSVSQC